MYWTLRYANRDIQVSPISTAIGGEGQIYSINRMRGRSVKSYFDPVPSDTEPRLEYLIANPPSSIAKQVAWPLDIVETGNCEVKGYLQKHFPPAFQSYTILMSSETRRRWATATFLHRAAQQIAFLIAELHANDYLFPDLHSEQLLVARNGSVVLIDAASCQFSVNNTLFPCVRIRDQDNHAPELLHGINWAEVAPDRNQYTDAWSLTVLVFLTLMGCHPFDGIHIGPGDGLSRKDRVKQGIFPFEYKPTHDYRPPKHAQPYRRLSPEIPRVL